MAKPKLWAVAPNVFRAGEHRNIHYDHDAPRLHRIFVVDIGGLGNLNGGEFLVESRCGYRGWVQQVNKNPEGVPACEACLNGVEANWVRWPIPEGAVAKDAR